LFRFVSELLSSAFSTLFSIYEKKKKKTKKNKKNRNGDFTGEIVFEG